MISFRFLSLLFFISLTVLCFLGPHSLTFAQFEDDMDEFHPHQQQQQQQQQITLTRDAIERLLQSLSSTCRVEMEGALATQTQDVSDQCKVEIQEALKHLSPQDFVTPGHQQHMMSGDEEGYDSMMQGDDDPFGAPASNRRAPKTRPVGSVSPSLAIAAFVVALLAAAGGFIFYRNSVSPADKAKSPVKKLSKKKEEKLRQKSAQRGY